MNDRLHDYLTEVETRLRHLPEIDREQEVTEVAQHLDGLIAARQSAGQTEEAATVAAIAQFGTAHEIGKRLYQTGKRKRFAPVLEACLFFTVFEAGVTTAWFLCVKFSSLFHPFTNAVGRADFGFPQVPMSCLLGFAALATIIGRYGWRGAKQRAFCPESPLKAGMHWLLLSLLLGEVFPYVVYVICCIVVVPRPFLTLNAYVTAMLFWLGAMWLAAYLVGRCSKTQNSVANVVGVAGAVSGIICLVQWVCLLITPWPPLKNVPFAILLCFNSAVFSCVTHFFIVRFFVRVGEKARHLPHHAKQPA